MKNIVIGVVAALVVLGGAGYWYWSSQPSATNGGEGVACTTEAKLCPDGVTYVGRTGPHCEFAACPTAATSTQSAPTVLNAGLNQTASGDGVTITPLKVTQDSRCPAGVYCIQAGTVVLQANVNGDVASFTLNQPVTQGSRVITLVEVAPLKTQNLPINDPTYTFTFEVKSL